MNELATIPPQQLATAPEPSIGSMMQAIIEGGITSESVDVMAKLCELRRSERSDDAKRAFASAFVALQRDLRPVQASSEADRYKFAAYETIMREVRPLLDRHGFGIRFDTETADSRITAICTLIHGGGHSESNRYSVRLSKVPGASDAQCDGASGTYARRYALCNALNITVEKDTDAQDVHNVGGPIDASEAAELEQRAKRFYTTPAKQAQFLKWAGGEGCASFADIPTSRIAAVSASLDQLESERK